ncbi:uncharacterized protein PHACADRAFT_205854 [Phanerochaete carnosa HHB-10118-sp]|uniref:Major facilitator superfamily (MFS) profile domain-containing protein n=1 Tax=Phanerochaete carnosa (strain HHB-10118-sp) TaxID=650164 RepID=K5WKE7_PHACS|nr:uncharacterized protein PHACADRAFT_205854 [Phanerochaete carnosa HHB-10118-sp]EKM59629.1 hypothetical protein PHACADRAFT_205854 [Phanerochaete carnosa HHB-10118-sp]
MSFAADVTPSVSSTSVKSIEKQVTMADEKSVGDVSSLEHNAKGSYMAAFPNIEESALMRKIDMRVIPFIFILNFFTFLDRVNISNAALFGLKQDLDLKGNEFNTVLLIYFVTYITCEMPSNMLLKHFKPHVWLPICIFGFGFVTIMEGLTKSYGGILVARFFLGFFESGIFPGCLYLISMWYRRAEASKRFTFFFHSNSLAGSFAGLLGYAIGHMDGMRGLHGWRWIFILEGTLTCVVAFALFFMISDFPEESAWLSEEEKAFVKARLADDVGDSGRDEKLKLADVLRPFRDYKSYLGALMYFGLIVPAYGFAYFSPTIIQGYGHSALVTQLLNIPPYFCAFVFGMTVAWLSDRLGCRFPFAMLGSCIGLVGFAILYAVHNSTHLEYAALFLAATGIYTAMPMVLCWCSMNVRGHAQRSVGLAFQIGAGNCGGIIAAYSFLTKDAPKYLPGYSICISFTCLAIAASCLYYVGISRANAAKRKLAGSESTALFIS